MSRFGDDGDGDYPSHWWQIDLERALTSGRGQRFLREIEAALLAMPEHKLIEGALVTYDEEEQYGTVCAVGAFAAYRAMQGGQTWSQALAAIAEKWGNGEQDDHWNTQTLGRSLGLARTVAYELAFQNDEQAWVTDEARWEGVLVWVRSKIKQEAAV